MKYLLCVRTSTHVKCICLLSHDGLILERRSVFEEK